MIINGNSESLPLADNSVDAVCCDPPYGLKFMGKKWDKAIPSVKIWAEVLRVMKPGAFAAILCTPRQDCQARMIINLEEAGFVTGFTSIAWSYATGFPKAANLSKLADKRAGVEREITGANPNYRNPDTDHHERWNSAVLNPNTTAPATPEAKALDGAYAGFQPKPAFEPVLIVMKPLTEKTYLDQALDNGKGCSWLDAGRIPTDARPHRTPNHKPGFADIGVSGGSKATGVTTSGRFPANVLCCDDCLDDGRVTKSTGGRVNPVPGNYKREYQAAHGYRPRGEPFAGESNKSRKGDPGLGDSGSYSRYFDLDRWFSDRIADLPESVRKVLPWLIVPKPSKREKNAGLEGMPEKAKPQMGEYGDNPGRTTPKASATPRANHHPTVKPVKLMSYLITLFSQPGDTVLDPFAGSGTTGVAADILGREFIGVELSPEYARIASARARHATPPEPAAVSLPKQAPPARGQMGLF